MSVMFRKVSIIPRWCHVKTKDRKAQHCLRFGCDVEVNIDNGVIKMKALSDGTVIKIMKRVSRRMNGGQKRYSETEIGTIHINACNKNCSALLLT